MLADFARRVRPTPRPLPDDAAQLLASLLTRRRQIVEMLTAEKNRLLFLATPLEGYDPVAQSEASSSRA